MMNNYQNIEKDLLLAYLQTDYRLKNTGISIQIDACNPQLDEFLIDNNAYTWVFISADNPQSIRASAMKNKEKRVQLQQFCQDNKLRYWPGVGIPKSGDWPTEEHLLVLDVPTAMTTEMMQVFNQKAVLTGALNQRAVLTYSAFICGKNNTS